MSHFSEQFASLARTSEKVKRLFERRVETAQDRFDSRVELAYEKHLAPLAKTPMTPSDFWTQWIQYTTDAAQRSTLFWNTLRQRGNEFLENEAAGKPPALHFEYEIVFDARTFERPVNYALVRIIPPQGVIIDSKRRPYIIVDPRAGHGPGIGGFKDDSEAGVALRDGHPVYFVIFFPTPEPGQTLLDVCAAERIFVRKVRDLHPKSPKPVLIGNCQGGWASMMVAASEPDAIGSVVIVGAPMSYWGGSFSENDSENPMRYAGGLLGGSWLSSFASDLGNGVFDGAHLVQNFENLNPANTFWDKYYNLFANIDTEPQRFLDFERWWGAYSLLNKQEIEWIVENLFVGNRLWSGEKQNLGGAAFDLREIKSPIVLFASMGDNITPPQQAFNWVADLYGSTAEIKARGQTIVGLLHHSVGHLGIFVSGKVAKKEHAQIVSVLKSIEMLPPGLYGMRILEHKSAAGKTEYRVEFQEQFLEEIVNRLNRFKRADERPFEIVAKVSEFNQSAYDLFVHPWVKACSNEYTAMLSRAFHPMRFQRWAMSDLNPWLAWLGPAADQAKEHRAPVAAAEPMRQVERMFSEFSSASLDYYRDLRDAAGEALFFETYGSLVPPHADDDTSAFDEHAETELKLRRQAALLVTEGGYAEAISRTGYLLSVKGRPLPLAQFELKKKLAVKYGHLLPHLTSEQFRAIRGKQEVICRYEPERAMASLPLLLSNPADLERFFTLLDAVVEDYSATFGMTEEQSAMLERIRELLTANPLTAAD
jgi:pimeloyl-ACP methyl ester carboxylesterase